MQDKKIPEGYKMTEIGVIPEDWNVKILGDIGEIEMCKRIFSNQTKKNGSIPFYKIGTFGNDANAYISEELYRSYRQRFSFPRKGSILISASGTIGRTIIYDDKPSYFQDSNIVWIGNNEKLISNKYLYHVLQIVNYNSEGSTIQRLYNSIIKDTKFILPPMPEEQEVIATVLSDMDELIEGLDKLIVKKKLIKQGTMQQLLTGKKRLPGFNGEWESKKLGEILKYEQPTKYIVSSTDYEDNARIPVLTAGKSFILGYTEERQGIYDNYPVIIFDDFTTSNKYVNFSFKVKSSAMKMLKIKETSKSDLKFIYERMQIIKYLISDGDHKRRWIGEYQNINIVVPLREEQKAIVQILSDMDDEIEKLEKKKEKYQQIKRGAMQVLLTGKVRLV